MLLQEHYECPLLVLRGWARNECSFPPPPSPALKYNLDGRACIVPGPSKWGFPAQPRKSSVWLVPCISVRRRRTAHVVPIVSSGRYQVLVSSKLHSR